MPSRAEIDGFFFYVEKFMLADVRREIIQARNGEPAGNFLAALGLLCYTEALGKWMPDAEAGNRASRHNWELFFRELGSGYAELLDRKPLERDSDTPPEETAPWKAIDPYAHLLRLRA